VTEQKTNFAGSGQSTSVGLNRKKYFRVTAESDRIYHFNRSINWNPTLYLSEDDGVTFGATTHFIATGSGGIAIDPDDPRGIFRNKLRVSDTE
jgi:hypothetical protein